MSLIKTPEQLLAYRPLKDLLAGKPQAVHSVRPTDSVTLAGVLLLLTAVASGACLVPARRATSADPIRALRSA